MGHKKAIYTYQALRLERLEKIAEVDAKYLIVIKTYLYLSLRRKLVHQHPRFIGKDPSLTSGI